MKTVALIAAALALGASAAAPRPAAAQTAPDACSPVGDLHFVCGPVNVEDLLPVDGGKFLVGGSFKAGSAGLYLIDTAAKTYKDVAISIAAKSSAGDPSCPAPNLKTLSTHGLDVKPGRGAARRSMRSITGPAGGTPSTCSA
jgi:hypothetical protein